MTNAPLEGTTHSLRALRLQGATTICLTRLRAVLAKLFLKCTSGSLNEIDLLVVQNLFAHMAR